MFVLSHASVDGALFPWSPVRPGYALEHSARATVIYPARSGAPAAYRQVDRIIDEVARANRLQVRKPVTVVVTDSWGLFNRGALLGLRATSLPVLGAALQTGSVIYLSPLVREPGRNAEAVLRHELTHALMFQQMPLHETFELVKLDWFEEGLAVHFGNPDDYLSDSAWRHWAADPAYRFGPWGDPELRRIPAELHGPFRLAEYRVFIEFLLERYGADRFFAFRDQVLSDPSEHQKAFLQSFGETFPQAVAAFERAVQGGEWPRNHS